METLHRRLFGEFSCFFELGGSAGMTAGPFLRKTMRNYPKLSWKSTTCDACPALPIDLNRTAGGFATAPFAADLISQISMNNPNALNMTTIPQVSGTATIISFAGGGEPALPRKGAKAAKTKRAT
jgi:hypothetical protein